MQGRQCGEWCAEIAARLFQETGRVFFQFDDAFHAVESVAKQKFRLFESAVNIADGLERAAFHALKQNGRALALKDLPVDFGSFQVGVNFFLDAQQHSVPFQIVHGIAKTSIGHVYSLI